jgi:hypothetical protein
VRRLLDWEGHIKLTDLGLCKKVEMDSMGLDEAEMSIHTAEAQRDNLQGAPSASMGGRKPHHRERELAYSTVGANPSFIICHPGIDHIYVTSTWTHLKAMCISTCE